MTFSYRKIHPDLPIFRVSSTNDCILYTPGRIMTLHSDDADSVEHSWTKGRELERESFIGKISADIVSHALLAVEEYQRLQNQPFTPECLLLYPSNDCNLNCTYCYSSTGDRIHRKDSRNKSKVVDPLKVAAAARLVAENCSLAKKPFTLVLNGGGEPTIHWDLLKQYHEITVKTANKYELDWYGHIATNGIVTKQQALWLARNFSSIGLSCDGPPFIQDRQRSLINGGPSSGLIEKTAQTILSAGGTIEARVTITPETIFLQSEIVSYINDTLGIQSIRFEPAYWLSNKQIKGFTPDMADDFVRYFISAQKLAGSLNCRLSFVNNRLNELHGTYCNIFRQVLHIIPEGVPTSCFFCVDTTLQGGPKLKIGEYRPLLNTFELDQLQINKHRRTISEKTNSCSNCINMYHCTRGCPEKCPLSSKHKDNKAFLFRCHAQQQIALNWIVQSSKTRKEKHQADKPDKLPGIWLRRPSPLAYLKQLPDCLDKKTIVHQWNRIKSQYRVVDKKMPDPIWQKRGFEQTGRKVWPMIQFAAETIPQSKPLCIYIHVPFCRRRCGFCDCYSIPLGKNRAEKDEKYFRRLISEINMWSSIPNIVQRPVTTVHFGGGTPCCLKWPLMEGIVEKVKNVFNIDQDTEWALESTVALIHDANLIRLRKLGFKRLHIGVQTLESNLRKDLGRIIEADAVIESLANVMQHGFITSVDTIVGLPKQTIKGLLNTFESLIANNLHGVSVYQLNFSKRNAWFFKKRFPHFRRDPYYEYMLFQIIDQMLTNSGYRKNHFAHYAKTEDKNLYFLHRKRDEDLVALGPTADGIIGSYHYRHTGYASYVTDASAAIPFMQGGVNENKKEMKYKQVITALMCGQTTAGLIEKVGLEYALRKWMAAGMLAESDSGKLTLTANGSWMINAMIDDVYSMGN